MEKIRIITDSASDIVTPAPAGITVLPMSVRFGEAEYLDGVTITHREFYEKLVESEELPATSLISPGDFESAFEKAVFAGEKVIAITVSGKLSGTYQSAVLAAREFEGEVFVVDSASVALGEQILVKRARELVENGMDIREIVSLLEEEKQKVHILALMDTLEYLKKGGRISKNVAFVGGVLSIKPVATIRDGEVALLGTARGSKNGNNFLIKEIEKTAGVDFTKPVALGYTGLSDALLQKYIADSHALWEGHEDSLDICCVGATIGTHIGPNAVAVAFFSK